MNIEELKINLIAVVEAKTPDTNISVNQEVASAADRVIAQNNFELNVQNINPNVSEKSVKTVPKKKTVPKPIVKSCVKRKSCKSTLVSRNKIRKVDNSFDISVNEIQSGSFVAVAFNGNWFPGEVINSENLENGSVLINYMHPHAGKRFVWPSSKDQQTTETKYIFAKLLQPIPAAGGRGSYICSVFSNHDNVTKQYQKYCKRFNMA